MIKSNSIQDPNEIQFGEEHVFDIETENGIIKLIVGDIIYIETDEDIFEYDKQLKIFRNDEGIELILSEDNKKIIEDAFNIAKV